MAELVLDAEDESEEQVVIAVRLALHQVPGPAVAGQMEPSVYHRVSFRLLPAHSSENHGSALGPEVPAGSNPVDTLLMKRARKWNYRRISLSDAEADGAAMVQSRPSCQMLSPEFNGPANSSH